MRWTPPTRCTAAHEDRVDTQDEVSAEPAVILLARRRLDTEQAEASPIRRH